MELEHLARRLASIAALHFFVTPADPRLSGWDFFCRVRLIRMQELWTGKFRDKPSLLSCARAGRLRDETLAIGKMLEKTMMEKYGPAELQLHYMVMDTICDATQARRLQIMLKQGCVASPAVHFGVCDLR